MELKVNNLKKIISFKDTTEINDLVLILQEIKEGGKISATYAQIIDFTKDNTKRDAWWHVKFLFLSLPPSLQIITLQTSHFTGQEIFTIGGKKIFIKALDKLFLNENTNKTERPILKIVK